MVHLNYKGARSPLCKGGQENTQEYCIKVPQLNEIKMALNLTAQAAQFAVIQT